METESEDEGPPRIGLRVPIFPYLKLYEKEEYEERNKEMLRQGEGTAYRHFWKFYRALRFIQSVLGFHEGSLDLSGRHTSRYLKLLLRWTDYLKDFQVLLTALSLVHIEIIFGDHNEQALKLTDQESETWHQSTAKWDIPDWILPTIINKTKAAVQILTQNPMPKFQQLCLHDLPIEIIRLVYRESSLRDARALSSTSKLMRDIGFPFIFGSRCLELKISDEKLYQIKRNTPIDSLGFFEAFQEYAIMARQLYLDDAAFLLSRGHLIQKLRDLFLINRWNPTGLEIEYIARGHMPDVQDPSFFDLIHEQNLSILQRLLSLTS